MFNSKEIPSILTRESFVEKYSTLWNKYYQSITENPQNYKITNKYAKELSILTESIIQQQKIVFLLDILNKDPEAGWGIALIIARYEPVLGKKLYTKWFQSDPKKHWVGKFRLDNWDSLENESSLDFNESKKIYEDWKGSNSQEYSFFIKELIALT